MLGIAVTARVPAARRLFGLFAVFLVAILVAFVIPSDLGSNVERLKFAAVPIALLAAALAPRRIVPVVALVAFACFWNITALARTARAAGSDPGHSAAYWQPAINYLRAHLSPSFRVEAVDTAEHWPAAYLPDAGIPIVRGWYRQNDFPQNELLYDHNLAARTYTQWLRGLGVRYVVITDAPPDYSSRGEAALVNSGHSRARAGLLEPARARLRAEGRRARSSPARATRTCSGCGRRAWSSPCRSRGATA